AQREAAALLGRWHCLKATGGVPAAPPGAPFRERPAPSADLVRAFLSLALSDRLAEDGLSRAVKVSATAAGLAGDRVPGGGSLRELAHALRTDHRARVIELL